MEGRGSSRRGSTQGAWNSRIRLAVGLQRRACLDRVRRAAEQAPCRRENHGRRRQVQARRQDGRTVEHQFGEQECGRRVDHVRRDDAPEDTQHVSFVSRPRRSGSSWCSRRHRRRRGTSPAWPKSAIPATGATSARRTAAAGRSASSPAARPEIAVTYLERPTTFVAPVAKTSSNEDARNVVAAYEAKLEEEKTEVREH